MIKYISIYKKYRVKMSDNNKISFDEKYSNLIHRTAEKMYSGADVFRKYFKNQLLNDEIIRKDEIASLIESSIKLVEQERFSEKRTINGDWWDFDAGLKEFIKLSKENNIYISNETISYSNDFSGAESEKRPVRSQLINPNDLLKPQTIIKNLSKLKNVERSTNAKAPNISNRLFDEEKIITGRNANTSRSKKSDEIVPKAGIPDRHSFTFRVGQKFSNKIIPKGHQKVLIKPKKGEIVSPQIQGGFSL